MTDDVPSPETVPLPQKVYASFRQLEVAATELNTVSDELGKAIAALDDALKPLNLGITTWVQFQGSIDENTGEYWARDIGYARVGSKWGIALRTREGDMHWPDHEKEEWPFSDAPRALRIQSVEVLPELLDALIEEATTTVVKIRDRIGLVQQVVAAVQGPAESQQTPQKAAIQTKLTGVPQASAVPPPTAQVPRAGAAAPKHVSQAKPPVTPVKGSPYPPTGRK
jgi:hypothetical protein